MNTLGNIASIINRSNTFHLGIQYTVTTAQSLQLFCNRFKKYLQWDFISCINL
jgi:hypothetical protein